MSNIGWHKKRRLGETLQVLRIGDWFVWAFAAPGGKWRMMSPYPAFSHEDMMLTSAELDAEADVLAEAMQSWRQALGMVRVERKIR
ncbi:MAG: hypothetical protein GX597_22315 [Anaerolineaceae bacterium]|nr:hypothetical protein [Anaerolineaceae bacterium]